MSNHIQNIWLSFLILWIAFKISSAQITVNFKVTYYTSQIDRIEVNSYILSTSSEVWLIDSCLTVPDAQNVTRLIQTLQNETKPFTNVFITHTHPDHYFGLQVIKNAFPNVAISADGNVATTINQLVPTQIPQLKQQFNDVNGSIIADSVPTITSWTNPPTSLRDGSQSIQVQVQNYQMTESLYGSLFYFPQFRVMFGGDLFYSNVHVFLGEQHYDQFIAFLEQLNNTYSQPDTIKVYPGHGQPRFENLTTAVEVMIQYIRNFQQALAESNGNQTFVAERMIQLYPNYTGIKVLQNTLSLIFSSPLPSPSTTSSQSPPPTSPPTSSKTSDGSMILTILDLTFTILFCLFLLQ